MSDKYELGGFEAERGEVIRKGDPRVYGVVPQPGNVPIGPAPPFTRQVLSVYDARPIGGYDFVLSGSFSPYNELPHAFVQSPFGYITVVRRIEVECVPGQNYPVSWSFFANGVAAVTWDWQVPRLFDHSIDTFFVIPPDVQFGIQTASLVGGFDYRVYVRYIGNLILDVNEPPNEQVGALPHVVYPMKKEI